MCIYLKNKEGLSYEKQEHILPAALGCCTKLDKGVVSDQANEYFSPIERDVIDNSIIQLPRIIDGPGKRGKLSPKYATKSNVMVIEHAGKKCLGYMKGSKGYILDQFIIRKSGDIQFLRNSNSEGDSQADIRFLKEKIMGMEDKYVPVDMSDDTSESVFVTYHKDKIHIGYNGELPPNKLKEISNVFSNDIIARDSHSAIGQISGRLEIKENFVNISKLVAKTALNTLAYIKGAEYISDTNDFDEIINMIFSDKDEILTKVRGVGNCNMLKQKLMLKDYQHACIISSQGNTLSAMVLFYERAYKVILCDKLSSEFDLLEGIVCDWKNRKDYKYQEYFLKVIPNEK